MENRYERSKMLGDELSKLSREYNICIMTATQLPTQTHIDQGHPRHQRKSSEGHDIIVVDYIGWYDPKKSEEITKIK